MQREFVSRAFNLPQVMLKQTYVPSSEGQVRAALAGWGVGVVPELLVRDLLQQGVLINIAPRHELSVQLYWHCWNLTSDVLTQLSQTLQKAAAQALKQV